MWWVRHAPFLVALLLGAIVRVVVQLAFTPALVHSDGPGYLAAADSIRTSRDRPVGYSLYLLSPLSHLTKSLTAVTITQHLLGLATAVVLYVLIRRRGVTVWPATLATLPVLLDSMQLILEQTVLSDTLFDLTLLLGFVALGWRRQPTVTLALAAGLSFGLAGTVRLVAEPLVVLGAAFCLLVGRDWRSRVATATAVVVGFALPVAAYATWYHHQRGVYALAQFSGKAAYMRTTSFVDCSQLSVPDYQRVLCPAEPVGERLSPGYYGWQDDRTLPRLSPPAGTSNGEALRGYALAAIRAQPGPYVHTVLRDFALNFDVWRTDRFDIVGAKKWMFSKYLDWQPNAKGRTAYDAHGGEALTVHQPYADLLTAYQRGGYLPGPLLLGCLVLGLVGGVGVGRARRSGLRAMCLFFSVSGVVLLLVPDVTAYFSWRYQLPTLILFPAGAALGYTALRGGQREGATEATDATPSTD